MVYSLMFSINSLPVLAYGFMNVAPVPYDACDVRTSRKLADDDNSESALFTVRNFRRLVTSSSVNTRSLFDGNRSDET